MAGKPTLIKLEFVTIPATHFGAFWLFCEEHPGIQFKHQAPAQALGDIGPVKGKRKNGNTDKIATLATLSKATVDNLLYGDTKMPRNSTVMAIATSLGYERTWKRTTNKFDLETELQRARDFIRAQAKLKEKAKRPKRKSRAKKKPHLHLVKSVA